MNMMSLGIPEIKLVKEQFQFHFQVPISVKFQGPVEPSMSWNSANFLFFYFFYKRCSPPRFFV